MEFQTRWYKIFKDMWDHRERSLLVILSIAIGVSAVGMIGNTAAIIRRDLFPPYQALNPAHTLIYVSPFQASLADAVEAMREVETADARRETGATLLLADGDDVPLAMITPEDFNSVRVSRFHVQEGKAVPGTREILLERQSAEGIGVTIGDSVLVEMGDERTFTLTVTGIVHDMNMIPYTLTDTATGYVSMETLQWMGESAYYNRLDIRVAGENLTGEYVNEVAGEARDRVIEPAGFRVGAIASIGYAGAEPGDFWAQGPIDGFLLVLQIMSILAIFLSSGLVVNTITAILTQQIKQIGIMRSIGAVRPQITGMYIVNILVYSLIGLLAAIPLGLLGSAWLANIAAVFLNFDITRVNLAPGIVALQAGLGLLMPLGVAMYPIVAGTRIKVYDAIYQYGLSGEGRRGLIDRLLVRLRNISPPVLLSLRNTFRKKTRLIFTLFTLTLAGAMFIAVFSTRASLNNQLRQVGRYIAFDASLNIPGGANRHTLEREALRIPGVAYAEAWGVGKGIFIREDGTEGDEIQMMGVPDGSRTVNPLMVQGRWLLPGDSAQIVINEDLLETYPDVEVGDTLTLKIDGLKRSFEVVGIASKHITGARIYMDYAAFTRITGRHLQADLIRVLADPSGVGSPALQTEVATALEERFSDAGLSDRDADTQHDVFGFFTDAFDIILIVLIVMAVLLAVVGGLSLTGTMGINVLERTREIGVLRAVGASNASVRQVVVIEGVVVGMISWTLAALLSAPVGVALAGAVVRMVLRSNLSFQYSLTGLFAWLAIIILIGVGSSLAPARSAELLTVREVLDYE